MGEAPFKETVRRMVHRMESENPGFDPYNIFEVEYKPCLVLEVKVICGRNIVSGWKDFFETPDPYVDIHVKSAPDGKKKTTVKTDENNPVWNETFKFLLGEEVYDEHVMEITLMESNYTIDAKRGSVVFNINELQRDELKEMTFTINDVSEIDMEFRLSLDYNPDLRYSLCLCDKEKAFLRKRKQKVLCGYQELLGERGPQSEDEVPTLAVIGSGGGFRAMVGLSGVFDALHETGLLQCATFVSGLSGSTWYISTLYSNEEWPSKNPSDLKEELKNNIDCNVLEHFRPSNLYQYIKLVMEKRRMGQPISLTDFFGRTVGGILLKERLESKLTDQQVKLAEGDVPLPLLSCIHAKKDMSAQRFHEWVEFSPYEIGIAKYGVFMPTELFGSKFFLGRLCKKFDEVPLHFLQGIWGSAFSILLSRFTDDKKNKSPPKPSSEETFIADAANQLAEEEEDESSDSSDDDGEIEDSDEENASRQPKPKTKMRTKKKSFWMNMLNGLSESILNTRGNRAGVIHNFMRGLALQRVYPFSPFSDLDKNEEVVLSPRRVRRSSTFSRIFEMHPTDGKHQYMVDGGLAFNSPYPLVMRPQREVDIILSFDFSGRESDDSPLFGQLLLAEKWAKKHKLPFPPIDVTAIEKEARKEMYIFKHPTDPDCPVVLHFCLVNIEFRNFVEPGVRRTTQEEKDFADFSLFDDNSTPYSTFNFNYTHQDFERLSKLTKFNTLLHVEKIKEVMAEIVQQKKAHRIHHPHDL